MASRVLPAPPGSTTVTSRWVATSAPNSSISALRPTNKLQHHAERGPASGTVLERAGEEVPEIVREDRSLELLHLNPGLEPELSTATVSLTHLVTRSASACRAAAVERQHQLHGSAGARMIDGHCCSWAISSTCGDHTGGFRLAPVCDRGGAPRAERLRRSAPSSASPSSTDHAEAERIGQPASRRRQPSSAASAACPRRARARTGARRRRRPATTTGDRGVRSRGGESPPSVRRSLEHERLGARVGPRRHGGRPPTTHEPREQRAECPARGRRRRRASRCRTPRGEAIRSGSGVGQRTAAISWAPIHRPVSTAFRCSNQPRRLTSRSTAQPKSTGRSRASARRHRRWPCSSRCWAKADMPSTAPVGAPPTAAASVAARHGASRARPGE